MIISELQGGLGNQLFQYAAGRALAERHGTELLLDVGHYAGVQRPAGFEQFPRSVKLTSFAIRAGIATAEQVRALADVRRLGPARRAARGLARRLNRRLFARLSSGRYTGEPQNYNPAWPLVPDNTWISGYWQSELFFRDIQRLIREELTPLDGSVAGGAAEYVRGVRESGAPDKPVVAVHVRRGDIAHAVEVLKAPKKIDYILLPLTYFRQAMARFDPDSNFVVFSDSEADLEWCRNHLRARRLSFCGGQTDLQDFAVMRACDHNIISNSSFSWWAAWLNPGSGKMVVAPEHWYHRDRWPNFRVRDLVPRGWTLIGDGPGASRAEGAPDPAEAARE